MYEITHMGTFEYLFSCMLQTVHSMIYSNILIWHTIVQLYILPRYWSATCAYLHALLLTNMTYLWLVHITCIALNVMLYGLL